jgi:hypothetical protein
MKGRGGRTEFLEELAALGVEEKFSFSDAEDVTVALPELGWKGKSVEILEINRPNAPCR